MFVTNELSRFGRARCASVVHACYVFKIYSRCIQVLSDELRILYTGPLFEEFLLITPVTAYFGSSRCM